ncbi:Chitin synthase [Mycena venus]|uniref:Chitin synthase n=1 Tax=Mycena venus TaxID=2733690 RepID=A0A8H6XK89_9AGAR|nr:Chitin synthase [Mycena venus]
MRISTVAFKLAVLSQSVGVLGLRGMAGAPYNGTTEPPMSIPSIGIHPPSATLSSSFPSNSTTGPTVSISSSGLSFVSSTLPSSSFSVTSTAIQRRAALPACLKTVELSCLNLAANCIDTVDSSTFNNLWGIKSCVAAATCYGVGDLITSVECQTGLTVTNTDQVSLDYTNIYAGIVGSCAFASGGCPITQQNYIDFYYGELTAINTANYPTSSDIVIALWNAITVWAAMGSTVPYLKSVGQTTTAPPIPSYTQIEWNPNPVPPSGAVSETFVKSTTTIVIAIPQTTTTVIIAGASITLAPGGTPVNGPLPSDVSISGAVTPTWNPNIIPPTSSWQFRRHLMLRHEISPPGDTNSNGDDWWLLLFGGVVGGLLPPDVGIPGGSTPTAAPPIDWTGAWTDPAPTSTSTTTTNSNSASSSASSSSSCPRPTTIYALSDDDENLDWEDDGTDPDRRRDTLVRRSGPRSITLPGCEISFKKGTAITNPNTVSLRAGTYYSLGLKAAGGVNTVLSSTNVASRPVGNGPNTVNQEHVFKLGYIRQYFEALVANNGITCAWIKNNVYNRAG